jgi:CheY-like chemotaxis protein
MSSTKIANPTRLLYVEDNRLNQLLIEAYLEDRPDLSLEVADSVDAALSSIHHSPPRIALIDMDISGRSGREVLHEIRRLEPIVGQEISCVALTAASSEEERDRALAEGFDAFWPKPISMAELLAGIDKLLDQT